MVLLRAIERGFRFRFCSRSPSFLQCTRRPTLSWEHSYRFRFSNCDKRYFASSADEGPAKESDSGKTTVYAPMTWLSFAAFFVLGSIGVYVLRSIKKQKDEEIAAIIAKNTKKIGRSLIGGPWELVNYDNQLVSWRDYLGKWLIIYFGFTHCPDICPEELEKLINVIENLKKNPKMPKIYPLFFTVDPYRDQPENIKEYCREYSPELVGFSGTVEQVAKVCKTFRVYFSEGPKTDNDYIVDHSIVMYLMNPEGEFVEHYTRETPEKRMEIKVRKRIEEYEAYKRS